MNMYDSESNRNAYFFSIEIITNSATSNDNYFSLYFRMFQFNDCTADVLKIFGVLKVFFTDHDFFLFQWDPSTDERSV